MSDVSHQGVPRLGLSRPRRAETPEAGATATQPQRPSSHTEEDVTRAAALVFLATGGLEMRALAQRLGIARATLYRWTGSRDLLLRDMLLWLGLRNLHRAEADVSTEPGPRRLLDVHALHISRMTDSVGLRTFVKAEPELASRLLLDANGTVHLGMTAALADLIRRQQSAGWEAPLAPDLLAHIVARVDETFMYADLIANDEPSPDSPQLVFEMMLGLYRTD
jgi:AcrR family transcriptional regulator